MMDFAFNSPEAKQLNTNIFETIYHAALEKSNEIAKELGESYSSFQGSPASKGILQYDLWSKEIDLRMKFSLILENRLLEILRSKKGMSFDTIADKNLLNINKKY